MRFSLVDRIVLLEPGVKITTVKTLSMAEEYLADHFPLFPVMPGVLMLEAMTQTAAWLVRVTDDFAHSVVTLKQARNLRFLQFVAPGQVLTISAEIVRHDIRETEVVVQGKVAGNVSVSGRLVLERYNLADHSPAQADTDRLLKRDLKAMLALIQAATAARPRRFGRVIL